MYAGVPVVTRSDGEDMASRVTTSANIVLGLEKLNAKNGIEDYVKIAVELGTNQGFFNQIREKLIQTCLQRNPFHPYWDVERYVKDFERGLLHAFKAYLTGEAISHIDLSHKKFDVITQEL